MRLRTSQRQRKSKVAQTPQLHTLVLYGKVAVSVTRRVMHTATLQRYQHNLPMYLYSCTPWYSCTAVYRV